MMNLQKISEFDTLEEYKEDLKKKLEEDKKAQLKREKEDKVVSKIIENSQMDIPDLMIDTQTRQMVDEFAQNMQYQGLTLEQYYQFTGTNQEMMIEQMNPQAIRRIKTRLILEEIVKVEEIKVSEEEWEKELEKMAGTYQMELDKLKEMIGDSEKEQMELDIAVQKAIDLVVEAASEVEVKEVEEDGEEVEEDGKTE